MTQVVPTGEVSVMPQECRTSTPILQHVIPAPDFACIQLLVMLHIYQYWSAAVVRKPLQLWNVSKHDIWGCKGIFFCVCFTYMNDSACCGLG